MTTTFGTPLAAWHDFDTAGAGFAAMLVGLCFVALAVRPQIMLDGGPAGMRVWLDQTVHGLLVVLVLSLTALIPDDDPTTLVITLLVIGLQGLFQVARDLGRACSGPDPQGSHTVALTRCISPTLAYLLSLWAAWALWQGDDDALNGMVAVVLLLLLNATVACWGVLKAIGQPEA